MNKKIRSTSDIIYIPKDNQIVSDLKKFHSNSLLYNVSNYTFEVEKNKIENKKEPLLIEENKETNEVIDKSNELESTLKNDINFENKDKNVISNKDNINNLNLNNLNDEIVENPNSIKNENEIISNNLIKDDAYITLAPDSKKDQPQKVVYEVQKSSDLVFTSNNIKFSEKSSEIITSVRFKGLLELLDKPLGSNELKKRNEKSKNLNIKQQFELPQMEKPNIHIKSKIDEIYDIIHKSNTGIKGTESNYIKDDKVRFNYKNKLSYEEKETTKIFNKKSYLKEKIYNDTYLKEANKKDLRYINLSNQLQSVKLKIDNIDFHLDKLYIKGSNSLHKGNRDI